MSFSSSNSTKINPVLDLSKPACELGFFTRTHQQMPPAWGSDRRKLDLESGDCPKTKGRKSQKDRCPLDPRKVFLSICITYHKEKPSSCLWMGPQNCHLAGSTEMLDASGWLPAQFDG